MPFEQKSIKILVEIQIFVKVVKDMNNHIYDLSLLYAIMLHARIFEETCAVLYTNKLIRGFCHLYSGQEAVGVGIQMLRTQEDNIITAYRCHVHAVVARMYYEHKEITDPTQIFNHIQQYIDQHSQAKSTLAEVMGKQTGSSKGKGGSMHLYDKEHNFYGGHGIVGIQIPLGVGLAFADKYRDKRAVTFASLGDGAMNQGQVYEAMNMAELWKLPVVFVLENNGYAIGTSVKRHAAGSGLWKRALAFDMPSYKLDGMNILHVMEEVQKAKEYALDNGPIFLEMDTYRYRPHSMSDAATYRTRQEVENIKSTRDPITALVKVLVEKYNITTSLLEQYEEHERTRMEEIKEYAINSLLPGEEELESDIWATTL